ncbi:hypothetical protein VUR80DRAFT_9771 [Thermomyces stellatus]
MRPHQIVQVRLTPTRLQEAPFIVFGFVLVTPSALTRLRAHCARRPYPRLGVPPARSGYGDASRSGLVLVACLVSQSWESAEPKPPWKARCLAGAPLRKEEGLWEALHSGQTHGKRRAVAVHYAPGGKAGSPMPAPHSAEASRGGTWKAAAHGR